MSPPAIARPAATLIVVRDAPGGLELLLLQRADKGDHNSGAWVFPGGLLDPADERCRSLCAGLDDAAASARLGVARAGLDFYVAAIRECFEEAGLLFAVDEHDRVVGMEGDAASRWAALRPALHKGERELAAICRDAGLRLAADRLCYLAHWVTPLGLPKRFDTRFFLAVLPEGQASAHDAIETLDHVWLRPASALSPENARRLLKVTRSMIETVGRFADTRSLLAWARSLREIPMVMQRRAMDSAGPRSVMPHEAAFAEIGRLDPQGDGTAWCELRPGVPVRLSSRVLRVTSRGEPSHNAYLVGGDGDGWTVIDPGPAQEPHIEALVAAAPGRIEWVLLTRPGVSPGAAMLAARTGARVRDPAEDAGKTIGRVEDTALRVVGAGDGSQRVCYFLIAERTLFSGDCATAGARVLPGLADTVEWIAPSHGFLLAAG